MLLRADIIYVGNDTYMFIAPKHTYCTIHANYLDIRLDSEHGIIANVSKNQPLDFGSIMSIVVRRLVLRS